MTDHQTSTSDAIRLAVDHHQAGRLSEAGEIYRQVLDADPDHADALHLLGVVSLQGGRHGEAADLIRRAIAARPDRATYHSNLGVARHGMGDPEGAVESYRAALDLEPGDAEVNNNLGNALQELGRHDEAIAIYRQAIDSDPSFARPHNNLGGAYRARGRLDDAIASYRRAVALDPRYGEALSNLGNALTESGRLDDAIDALDRSLTIDPRAPATLNNLGNAHHRRGALDDAAAAFQGALAVDPGYSDALNNLGSVRKDQGRLDQALTAYGESLRLNRMPGASRMTPPDTFRRTTRGKLDHDIEQFRYLMARDVLSADYGKVVADYEAVRAELSGAFETSHQVTMPAAARRLVAPTYNRLIHLADAPALPGGAVNPAVDGKAIEADYHRNAPGITFFDDLLTPEALAGLRRFALESTIWYDCRYPNGYLGAFMQDGFFCPLLVQIAEDLRRALPGLLSAHRLMQLWAFKYDSHHAGIKPHADFAAVNVNFWITPDDANLAPGTGGLNIWDKEAPAGWDFRKYNRDDDAIAGFIAETGARMVKVPHRQNRAVVFNSDLFHETDSIHFKDGYENRRINVTMLFGHREDS